MAPFYEFVCKQLQWDVDQQLLKSMQEENKKQLETLDEAIEDADKNLGEMEVREANLKKAEYLCRIGDKDASVLAFRKTYEKTVSLGHRLDLIFHLIRIGLFYMDHSLITRNIEKAKSLIEEGGDWDRRNRLKVYQGTYSLSIRDFKTAAQLFLDTVSTFTSYELMDYVTFVTYTVYVSMIALPRKDLQKKVVKGSEILEVLHGRLQVREYLFSLYNCKYADFFKNLARVEGVMKRARLWAPHVRYYVREMRILAYTQLLESYRSLTLNYMAESFGVSTDYIDQELSRFIAAGRLHCRIDKVGGIVETNRPDSKNYQYQSTIKQGDILLNRIQKLSRVINGLLEWVIDTVHTLLQEFPTMGQHLDVVWGHCLFNNRSSPTMGQYLDVVWGHYDFLGSVNGRKGVWELVDMKEDDLFVEGIKKICDPSTLIGVLLHAQQSAHGADSFRPSEGLDACHEIPNHHNIGSNLIIIWGYSHKPS